MVEVTYVTDPACPASWAAEPGVRRVLVEFAGQVRFTYVMGGLARIVGDGVQFALALLEAGAASGMPVDARGWLADAPRSTHPACLAVVAAREQGLDGRLLRVLREGFCLRRGRPDTRDALLTAARGVPGLDPVRFGYALDSSATVEAFGEDLELARDVDRGRPALPALLVEGAPVDAAELRAAVLAAGAQPTAPPAVGAALAAHGPLAAAEVAALCDLPALAAGGELWRLALAFRARPERLGSGELWHVG